MISFSSGCIFFNSHASSIALWMWVWSTTLIQTELLFAIKFGTDIHEYHMMDRNLFCDPLTFPSKLFIYPVSTSSSLIGRTFRDNIYCSQVNPTDSHHDWHLWTFRPNILLKMNSCNFGKLRELSSRATIRSKFQFVLTPATIMQSH